MPFDNVYREKKMPSPLLYTWRLFYTDTLAMVGFYGVLGLLLLCLLGSTLANGIRLRKQLCYKKLSSGGSY